jgi:hypothetical protein
MQQRGSPRSRVALSDPLAVNPGPGTQLLESRGQGYRCVNPGARDTVVGQLGSRDSDCWNPESQHTVAASPGLGETVPDETRVLWSIALLLSSWG